MKNLKKVKALKKKLNDKFPNYRWDLKEEHTGRFRIMCNEHKTKLRFFQFTRMFFPSFNFADKMRMEDENIQGILERVDRNGPEELWIKSKH